MGLIITLETRENLLTHHNPSVNPLFTAKKNTGKSGGFCEAIARFWCRYAVVRELPPGEDLPFFRKQIGMEATNMEIYPLVI
jgi:hypothetical protein